MYAGDPNQLKLGSRFEGDGWRLEILVGADHMEAYVQFVRTGPNGGVSPELIRDKINEAGLWLSDQDHERLKAVLPRLATGQMDEPVLVATGQPPQDAGPSPINWQVKFGLDRDPDGDEVINHYDVCHYANVEQGQVLCYFGQPEPAQAGRDVYGNELSAPNTQMADLPFRLGAKVAKRPDQQAIVARTQGCATFSGDLLNIEQLLEINGDVDFSVGNIDFNGKVVIRGSVLPDFSVKATRDVVIQGDVIAASIQTPWSITINGGVFGRNRAAIKAGSHVNAKYLNTTRVEAGRNVVVQRGIMNCRVVAAGDLVAENGAVIGGTVRSGGNVRVAMIGSDSYLPTLVASGLNIVAFQQRDKLRRKLHRVNTQKKRLEAAVGPLLADPERLAALKQRRADQAGKEIAKLLELTDEAQHLVDDIRALTDGPTPKQSYITFSRAIFANSELQIGMERRRKFYEDIRGSFKVRRDPEEDKLVCDRY